MCWHGGHLSKSNNEAPIYFGPSNEPPAPSILLRLALNPWVHLPVDPVDSTGMPMLLGCVNSPSRSAKRVRHTGYHRTAGSPFLVGKRKFNLKRKLCLHEQHRHVITTRPTLGHCPGHATPPRLSQSILNLLKYCVACNHADGWGTPCYRVCVVAVDDVPDVVYGCVVSEAHERIHGRVHDESAVLAA